MNIKELVLAKIEKNAGSPELKAEIAGLAQDAVEADDIVLLMGPMSVFHEGARYNTAQLSDEEFEEMLGFIPNVVIDDKGYIDNVEYLTEPQTYRLMKRWGILSLVARILEAQEVGNDRLWELAKKHMGTSVELQQAVVSRGLRAINEWDVKALDGELSYVLEILEKEETLSPADAKQILDDWGVTALVKELIG